MVSWFSRLQCDGFPVDGTAKKRANGSLQTKTGAANVRNTAIRHGTPGRRVKRADKTEKP